MDTPGGRRLPRLTWIALALFLLTACGSAAGIAVPTLSGTSRQPGTAQPAPFGGTPTPGPRLASLPLDDQGFADPAFRTLWDRSATPANGSGSNWLWGSPVPLGARQEAYAEAPGGTRVVQYFDKGRMELTDPSADPNGDWYVTNGLLSVELVTGREQVGANAYVNLGPAAIPVIGDLESPAQETPRYADFTQQRLAPAPNRTGQAVTTQFISGQPDQEIAAPAPVTLVSYDQTLGHNVPDVFVNFFNGQLAANRLNWLFVMGHPISEPYWVSARVDGKPQLVLVQLFERRALSYNPAGAAGSQIELTNIGLHYFRWRYHDHPA